MSLPLSPQQSQPLEIARKCVAGRLMSSVLPGDVDDLVETGLLDSMGWVDTLICI